jgi:hypothetical protein
LKKVLVAMTAVTVVVLFGMTLLPSASAGAEANNWFVCKYVGPPGTPNETLAGGQNPIFVDENAIDVTPVTIGATFGDAQTHSIVIAGPYSPNAPPDPEPTCPVTPTTSPPPCPNGTETITVTQTVTKTVSASAPLTVDNECTVTQTITETITTTAPPPCEERCETTTSSPPPPPPTTTTPPPTGACPGKVTLGPWYGDPRVNITLTGAGHFVVSGGVQRFSDLHRFDKTLACNETFKIGRYKIGRGHYLTITQDGVIVVHVKPPRVR